MVLSTKSSEAPHLCIVEDDIDDQYLITNVLKKLSIEVFISIFNRGDAVLNYLSLHEAQFNQLPDLILLDLNMPSTDGIGVLKKLRRQPIAQFIPVVIFTTSKSPTDFKRVLELGASSCIIKPSNYDDMVCVLDTTCRYWFEVSRVYKEIWY
ncbi:response regulator [Aliikangiella maris]|uniref:Response regulator n=2 Tax=Aliikangiella maris TaxID=3162458 RepID=A0ABV3MR31_9GAMM